jgi:hypothetical protein
MKTELLLDERVVLDDDCFVELVIWRLPAPARGSAHGYKYRLALIENGICTLRYDNEAGKGDHRHIGSGELSYTFTTPEDLLADFWSDVDGRRGS